MVVLKPAGPTLPAILPLASIASDGPQSLPTAVLTSATGDMRHRQGFEEQIGSAPCTCRLGVFAEACRTEDTTRRPRKSKRLAAIRPCHRLARERHGRGGLPRSMAEDVL